MSPADSAIPASYAGWIATSVTRWERLRGQVHQAETAIYACRATLTFPP
jgi:hypothetical protein